MFHPFNSSIKPIINSKMINPGTNKRRINMPRSPKEMKKITITIDIAITPNNPSITVMMSVILIGIANFYI